MRNDETERFRIYDTRTACKAWRDKVLLSNKVFRRDTLDPGANLRDSAPLFEICMLELDGDAFKAQAAGMVLVPLLTRSAAEQCPSGLGVLACLALIDARIWTRTIPCWAAHSMGQTTTATR